MTEKKVDLSKLTDFEISLLIIERDTAQFRKERIDELLNMVGAAKGFEDAERKEPPVEQPKKLTWNPERINWVQAKGARGDYERYPAEDQKIEATEDYKALLLDLKEHKLFFFKDGWNYWLFPDLVTVGRKRKEARP